ncbi:MAG: arginase family protein [Bacteroidetes bacterium]|nr:arginase family protein [Bacteroidota bacterium]
MQNARSSETFSGVRINAPGTIAEFPDICIDDMEGVFVCWRQNGSEIMLAHVDSGATITGHLMVMSGNVGVPRVVEDDSRNVYLCYTGAGGFHIGKYSMQLQQIGGLYNLNGPGIHYPKMVKDRERGVWCAYRDYSDVQVFAWGGATVSIYTGASVTSGLALNPVYEYDMVADVHPSDLAGSVKNMSNAPFDRRYDLLLTFTARSMNANFPVNVYAVRCWQQGTAAIVEAPVQMSFSTVTGDRQYYPSIAVDSIPNAFNPGTGAPETGGALIAWTTDHLDPVTQQRYAMDYTVPVTIAQLWGNTPRAMSPMTGIANQLAPRVQTLPQNPPGSFIPLLWSDDRSGSPCLVATSILDVQQNGLHEIEWRKETIDRGTRIPATTLRVTGIAPHPYSSPMSIHLEGESRWIEMRLIDLAGRTVGRVFEGEWKANGPAIVWNPPFALTPGLFCIETTGVGTYDIRPIIVTR